MNGDEAIRVITVRKCHNTKIMREAMKYVKRFVSCVKHNEVIDSM